MREDGGRRKSHYEAIRGGLERELRERGLEHESREITRKTRKGFEVFAVFREVWVLLWYFEGSN
jgi:hypothetical protein